MAEPFSTIAGVAGFVSLGIELCKGLKGYVSTFRQHGSDVRRVFEKLGFLETSLGVLKGILQELEPLIASQPPGVSSLLNDSINQCEFDMLRLQAAVVECGGIAGRNATSTAFQATTSSVAVSINSPPTASRT